ncbi:hypothetical protein BH10PLA1_BH10PLA1_10060 [soil metagenome]
MMYRGFKIERFVRIFDDVDFCSMPQPVDASPRVQVQIDYVVSESIAQFHWQEIGSTNNRAMAKEMVDRVADVRIALETVINGSEESRLESDAEIVNLSPVAGVSLARVNWA